MLWWILRDLNIQRRVSRERRLDALRKIARYRSARVARGIVPLLEDRYLRRDAQLALAAIGSTAVEVLLQSFEGDLSRLDREIEEALIAIGPPAVEPLLRELANGKGYAHYSAFRILAELKEARAIGPLTRIVESGSLYEQEMALNALAELKADQAIEPCVDRLRHSSRSMRVAAAKALATLNWQSSSGADTARFLVTLRRFPEAGELGEVAVPALVQELQRDDLNKDGVEPIAIALAKIGGRRAADAVATLLESRHLASPERESLISCLMNLRDPRCLSHLIRLIADLPSTERWSVRYEMLDRVMAEIITKSGPRVTARELMAIANLRPLVDYAMWHYNPADYDDSAWDQLKADYCSSNLKNFVLAPSAAKSELLRRNAQALGS